MPISFGKDLTYANMQYYQQSENDGVPVLPIVYYPALEKYALYSFYFANALVA